jgi:hypothetical protein
MGWSIAPAGLSVIAATVKPALRPARIRRTGYLAGQAARHDTASSSDDAEIAEASVSVLSSEAKWTHDRRSS